MRPLDSVLIYKREHTFCFYGAVMCEEEKSRIFFRFFVPETTLQLYAKLC